jgi:DNA-binding response OmpR family regulator/TolA-binding protein
MQPDFSAKRYLIIDDFAEARDSMRQMLFTLGARDIDSAASAEMALQLCRQKRYDIILCDYLLGAGRKDGQQLLDELRHFKLLHHTSCFIMVSAETSQAGVMGALEYQPDSYLAKPFNQLMLKKRLERLLRFKQATRNVDKARDREQWAKVRLLCEDALEQQLGYQEHFQKQLGLALLELKELDAARKHYRQVLQNSPLPWAQLGLAEVEFRAGDSPGAERMTATLINQHPIMLPAYDLLARCQLRQDRPHEAQATLERAATLSPRALLRHCELGRLARRNQDSEAAAEAYKHASRLARHTIHQTPDNELNWARSLTEASEAQPDNSAVQTRVQAHRVIDDAVKLYPADKRLIMNTELLNTRLYTAAQRDREAQAAMIKAERLLAASDIALDQDAALDMVRAHKAVGRNDEARTLLQTLTLEDHENAVLKDELDALGGVPSGESPQQVACREANKRGMSHYMARDYQAAIQAFEEGLVESPQSISINLNLVQALIMQIRDGSADSTALARAEKALQAGERLGLADYRRERYEELKRLFAEVNVDMPSTGSAS